MASVTLAESAKLSQNMLVAGVIENIIDVNPFYEILPFQGIEGNALAYNRENSLGDVGFYTVGDAITAKNPATFKLETASLTAIIGDAEVDGLIQATRSNITDQKAIQIASKAKSIGRAYQNALINGTGSGNTFEGLLKLVDSNQIIGNTAGKLTFEKMDELIDSVKDKDGNVDYLMAPARTIRSYYALLRKLGGASIGDVVTLPSGRQVPAYRGIPLFRNDYIATDMSYTSPGSGSGTGTGTTANTTVMIAGTLDDGSNTHGIAGITASNNFGVTVENVGVHQSADQTITRVKFYCGLALFSLKGLSVLKGITD